ncbi:zinc metalloprotease HtpX [Anaerovorax odorimutans]|uniref:zinc metalloprotease HtpX n=1 Tax=Anaerovorax odorimutans TaxID=109327 RepID=UPI00040A87DE|nr:zinc metalloprotease HtpX [Anaerovorax odorimutans]
MQDFSSSKPNDNINNFQSNPIENQNKKMAPPPPPIPNQKTTAAAPLPPIPNQKTMAAPLPPITNEKIMAPPPPIPNQRTTAPPPPIPNQKTTAAPPTIPNQKTTAAAPPPPIPNQRTMAAPPPPISNQRTMAAPPPPISNQRTMAVPPSPIPNQKTTAAAPPPIPNEKTMVAPPPPIPNYKAEAPRTITNKTNIENKVHTSADKIKEASDKIKQKSDKIKQKVENLNKEESVNNIKKYLKIALDCLSKIYIIDFFRRLFKKNNIGTIIFLALNLLLYIALFGGFAMPQIIPMAIFLYIISLMIALSPFGEFILRFQSGCKKLSKFKNKEQAQRIQRIFEEVYAKAREFDPSISPKVKIFISKDEDMNAFATGRKTVCVTKGLLKLSDGEIKGILGHEFGHLAHKDTDLLLVILVSNILLSIMFVILRVIVTLFIFLIGEGESSFGGIGNLIVRILVDLLLLSLIKLWTKLGVLLVMHSSRQNEFEADKFSAEIGYGNELACGLNTIDGDSFKKGFFASLRSSHPDTTDRIDRVKNWLSVNKKEFVPNNISSINTYSAGTAPMGMAAAFPPSPKAQKPVPNKPIEFMRTEEIEINNFCYGRFSEDGRMHYGQVLNIQDVYADFLFLNNNREWVHINCLTSVKDALNQLKAFGFNKQKGTYDPCHIQQKNPDGNAVVKFNDGRVEMLNEKSLIFICPPNM